MEPLRERGEAGGDALRHLHALYHSHAHCHAHVQCVQAWHHHHAPLRPASDLAV